MDARTHLPASTNGGTNNTFGSSNQAYHPRYPPPAGSGPMQSICLSRTISTFAIKVQKHFSFSPSRALSNAASEAKPPKHSTCPSSNQRLISPNQTNSFSISRIRSQLAPPVLTSLFCCINLLITSAGEVEQNQASPDTGAAGNASSSCPSLSSRSTPPSPISRAKASPFHLSLTVPSPFKYIPYIEKVSFHFNGDRKSFINSQRDTLDTAAET